MDRERSRLGSLVAGIAGIALIVDSWQPWYRLHIPARVLDAVDSFAGQLGILAPYARAGVDVLRQNPTLSLNAHDVFKAIDVELVLLGAAAAAIVLLSLARSAPLFTDGDGPALALLGCLVVLLVGYRLLDPPGPSGVLTPLAGAWAGLVCGLAMLGGGLAMRSAPGARPTTTAVPPAPPRADWSW